VLSGHESELEGDEIEGSQDTHGDEDTGSNAGARAQVPDDYETIYTDYY
jgi:hypothetical protein